MSDVKLNVKPLQNILKSLKKKPPIARVGILGSTNKRNDSSTTNATIGAVHEFGSDKIPMRSFLRVPISENLQKKLESTNMFHKEELNKIVETKSLVPWVKKLALIAEAIVLEGFNTEGYGKWVGLNPETMARKKVKQILTETQQLRNSITSEVKESD